jgi:hypothetical protein
MAHSHGLCLEIPLITERKIIKNKRKEEKKNLFLHVSSFQDGPFLVHTVYDQISILINNFIINKGIFSPILSQLSCLHLTCFSTSLHKNNFFLGFMESTHPLKIVTL